MKIMKTVEIPAEKRELVDYVLCDICEAKGDDEVDGNNWSNKSNEFNNTTLILEEGTRYYDGGESYKTEIHICNKCMKEKLFKWLQEQGVSIPKPTYIEW